MGRNERDVLVLLSTHNGEAFIAEQLSSLQAQSAASRIQLLVRDDGSSDATVSIIESLDLAPLAVSVQSGANLGACASFAALAKLAPDGFGTIMLCDQDDVWLPDKVAIAARALAATEAAGPALYCGRSTITDQALNPIGLTDDAPRGPSLRNALFQNIAPGHTMAFNQALLTLFRDTIDSRALMHDWWLYLLATALGTVVFDPAPQANYRLHTANEVGYTTGPVQRLTSGLTRLFREDRSALTRQAEALQEQIGEALSPDQAALLAAFLDQASLRSRLAFLRRYPLVAQQRRRPVVSTLLFLIGRYRSR